MIEVFWPVFVAMVGFIIYKIIPYFRTKIFIYEYYNIDLLFYLLEYEMIGSFVAHIIILVTIIAFGNSTLQRLVLKEYICVWFVITIIYLLFIYIIIKVKKEKGNPRYLLNVILGFFIYGILSVEVLNSSETVNNENITTIFLLWLIMIFFQIFLNLKEEKIKDIEYRVHVEEKVYISKLEPIQRGKYFLIKIAEQDGREWIQIPEEKIDLVEYYIKNIVKKEKSLE